MKLTAYQTFIQILSLGSSVFLFVTMGLRKSFRCWPSLFAMAIFQTVQSFGILILADNYTLYFYTFWLTQILIALAGFGIIFDIVRAIPGVTVAPANLLIGFCGAAIAMSLGSAWLASAGGPHTFHVTVLALSLERCMAVMWGTFAISLFYAVGFCGLGWTPTPLRLAVTFLILTLLSIGNSYAMSAWVGQASRIYDFFNFCTIGITLSWSGVMHFEKDKEIITTSDGARTFARALMLTSTKTAN